MNLLHFVFMVLLGLIASVMGTASSSGNTGTGPGRKDISGKKLAGRQSLNLLVQQYTLDCFVDESRVQGASIEGKNYYPKNRFCRLYLDCNSAGKIIDKGKSLPAMNRGSRYHDAKTKKDCGCMAGPYLAGLGGGSGNIGSVPRDLDPVERPGKDDSVYEAHEGSAQTD
ncbi:hypothetical protein Daus18300_012290 [Diaporthe australafricana]|uniref:Uncharacterized protein n=1 Tax=Diaporthe australafricana TaxID=127596 RepID=A0ABR3W376_9PEZI